MSAHAYCEAEQIVIEGEINFSTVTELWNESLPLLANLRDLIFDLSKVSSANSAGITLLIEWLKYAAREGKTISFNHIPASMISLADITGLDAILYSRGKSSCSQEAVVS